MITDWSLHLLASGSVLGRYIQNNWNRNALRKTILELLKDRLLNLKDVKGFVLDGGAKTLDDAERVRNAFLFVTGCSANT